MLQVQLFTFSKGSRVVVDRHLLDGMPPAEELRRHLWLKVKAGALKRNGAERLRADELVAGKEVGKRCAVEHVKDPRERSGSAAIERVAAPPRLQVSGTVDGG